MTAAEVADLLRETLLLILKMSSPLLFVALIIGVVVSLLQALIQVQEQTLTFVPKLFAVFGALILFSGFITKGLMQFTQELFVRIMSL